MPLLLLPFPCGVLPVLRQRTCKSSPDLQVGYWSGSNPVEPWMRLCRILPWAYLSALPRRLLHSLFGAVAGGQRHFAAAWTGMGELEAPCPGWAALLYPLCCDGSDTLPILRSRCNIVQILRMTICICCSVLSTNSSTLHWSLLREP